MVFGIVKRVQACVNRGLHVARTISARLTKPIAHSPCTRHRH